MLARHLKQTGVHRSFSCARVSIGHPSRNAILVYRQSLRLGHRSSVCSVFWLITFDLPRKSNSASLIISTIGIPDAIMGSNDQIEQPV